jgi:hypothetical protein
MSKIKIKKLKVTALRYASAVNNNKITSFTHFTTIKLQPSSACEAQPSAINNHSYIYIYIPGYSPKIKIRRPLASWIPTFCHLLFYGPY